ncbi:MAG: hypothetical protein KTR30_12455 [Saprospiraceae bacterium]|nr:hypothetical protein [Saprospiraceae bacterium]
MFTLLLYLKAKLMAHRKLIVVMCLCFFGLPCHGQRAHVFQLGYNYSVLRALDRTPIGNSTVGTLHKTRNFRGRSGGSIGYEWYLPFKEILYFSFGGNVVWYQSELEYSVDFYGTPCSGCQQFKAEERIGGPSAYSTISFQLPISISIPLTEEADWYLKLGWDALVLLDNKSRWNYVTIDWEYAQQNNQWSSNAVKLTAGSSSLDVYSFRQGITLALWKKTNFERSTFTLQPSIRLGIGRMNVQPILGQVNFEFKVGYWLAKQY